MYYSPTKVYDLSCLGVRHDDVFLTFGYFHINKCIYIDKYSCFTQNVLIVKVGKKLKTTSKSLINETSTVSSSMIEIIELEKPKDMIKTVNR